MENIQYLTIGILVIFAIWGIILFTKKKKAVTIPTVSEDLRSYTKEDFKSVDDKEWDDFIKTNSTIASEEILPPINLEPSPDDFSEPHMDFEIIRGNKDFAVVQSSKEYKQEVEDTTTKVKEFLKKDFTPEEVVEAKEIEVKSEVAFEKLKRKYTKKVTPVANVFDKKLYTFGDKGVGDFQIGVMVLWNNKVSKISDIKGKQAHICTFIKGEEICKLVNISALAIANLIQ